MLGIIYLILCMLTGMEMAGCLFPRQTTERGNRIWVVLPAAFGMGILMLTWAVYILSWMFSICAGAEHPLFYGNLIVFLVDILLLSGIFRWKKKKQQKIKSDQKNNTEKICETPIDYLRHTEQSPEKSVLHQIVIEDGKIVLIDKK